MRNSSVLNNQYPKFAGRAGRPRSISVRHPTRASARSVEKSADQLSRSSSVNSALLSNDSAPVNHAIAAKRSSSRESDALVSTSRSIAPSRRIGAGTTPSRGFARPAALLHGYHATFRRRGGMGGAYRYQSEPPSCCLAGIVHSSRPIDYRYASISQGDVMDCASPTPAVIPSSNRVHFQPSGSLRRATLMLRASFTKASKIRTLPELPRRTGDRGQAAVSLRVGWRRYDADPPRCSSESDVPEPG
jgi:hypothetical protein